MPVSVYRVWSRHAKTTIEWPLCPETIGAARFKRRIRGAPEKLKPLLTYFFKILGSPRLALALVYSINGFC